MRIWRYWTPVVVWAALISFFSTASFSSDSTSRFILPILRWLFPTASAATLQWLHFLVRKGAHLTEYFIFALLILRAVRAGRPGWKWRWAFAAAAIAACYATLDEFHQSFVPGRTASPYDSMLDTAGAVLGLVCAWLLARRRERRAQRLA